MSVLAPAQATGLHPLLEQLVSRHEFTTVDADSIDDFVTVRYLTAGAGTEPLSVKIYNAARASPTPAVNAAATLMLISTFTVIGIGFVAYRFATKGQRRESALKDFAAFE